MDELRAKREELKQLRDDLESESIFQPSSSLHDDVLALVFMLCLMCHADKKKEAEEPEKEAKDKHKAMWEGEYSLPGLHPLAQALISCSSLVIHREESCCQS